MATEAQLRAERAVRKCGEALEVLWPYDSPGEDLTPRLAALIHASLNAFCRRAEALTHRNQGQTIQAALERIFDTLLRTQVKEVIVAGGTREEGEREIAPTLVMLRGYQRLVEVLQSSNPREPFFKAVMALSSRQSQIDPQTPLHAPCEAMMRAIDELHAMTERAAAHGAPAP